MNLLELQTIEVIMNNINNHFIRSSVAKQHYITNGVITSIDLDIYKYVYIQGSILNDGLHHIDLFSETLIPEIFQGTIHLVAPPRAFEPLCNRIHVFNQSAPVSNIKSESFGGFSQSFDNTLQFQSVFGKDLNNYRKMFTDLQTSKVGS